MAEGSNKFEVDLRDLPLNVKQRLEIAAKMQSLIRVKHSCVI